MKTKEMSRVMEVSLDEIIRNAAELWENRLKNWVNKKPEKKGRIHKNKKDTACIAKWRTSK